MKGTTVTITANATQTDQTSNVDLIPELAPYWQKLDFRDILSRPAAFVSISQSNSVYSPGGLLYHEGHDKRGSIPATIKVVEAARKKENFISFNWVGYSLFRDKYPQTEFDKLQFDYFTGEGEYTEEEKDWDISLVDDLRAMVQPGDNELFEKPTRPRSSAPTCRWNSRANELKSSSSRASTWIGASKETFVTPATTGSSRS